MVCSTACTAPPRRSLRTVFSQLFYPNRKRLKVMATANPHTLRIWVTMCPTGLQQWSESDREAESPGQPPGLATPNIVNRGRCTPQTDAKGRRHHVQRTVLARRTSAICLLLMCNVWVARPILSWLHHTPDSIFPQPTHPEEPTLPPRPLLKKCFPGGRRAGSIAHRWPASQPAARPRNSTCGPSPWWCWPPPTRRCCSRCPWPARGRCSGGPAPC